MICLHVVCLADINLDTRCGHDERIQLCFQIFDSKKLEIF